MGETLIHLRPEDYVTTAWSGGTTTQLRIFPEGAVYADRSFLWRISSATVAVKESDFTSLPDYHRLISVLEGEMILSHNGHEPFTLQPYEVHAFEGSDATHSAGLCTDFNLMLRRNQAEGTVEALSLEAEERAVGLAPGLDEVLLYCAEGSCSVTCKGKELVIGSRESLLIRQPEGGALTVKATGCARLMLCRMRRI